MFGLSTLNFKKLVNQAFSKPSWKQFKNICPLTALFKNTREFNRNYDHKQQTLKHRNTQNGSKYTNHKSQTMTFWTRRSKLVFPMSSAKISKMIDGSEKRKCQLALNFRIRVFLKRAVSNTLEHFFCFPFISGTFPSKRRALSSASSKKTWLRHYHFVPGKHARISLEQRVID